MGILKFGYNKEQRMKIRMYVFAICLQFYGCLYVLGLTMRIRVV